MDWQNVVDIVFYFILVKQLTSSPHIIVATSLTPEPKDHSLSKITSRSLIQEPKGRLYVMCLGLCPWS